MNKSLKCILGLLLLATLVIPFNVTASPDLYYIVVEVTATTDMPAGTPVVIKVGDILPQLTGSYSWDNIYVIHGNDVVPAQLDKIGESVNDYEIVFELVTDIPAGDSDTYKILVAREGESLPPPAEKVCTVTIESPYQGIEDLGPALILSNDLISVVVLNESDWIAGTIFSAYIKASGYDVVKQGREGVDNAGWRWSRYCAEGDPGWAEKNPDFNVLYISEGPVRSVIVIKSTEPHGSVDGAYAVKKYAVYKGQPYAELELTVTGPGYTPGTKIPVKASFVDMGDQGIEHDTIYVPGTGELSRMEGKGLRLENFTEYWFAVYKKAEGKGFGVIFYPADKLLTFDWGSPGAELALHFEDGIPVPFYRVMVLFDSTITSDPLTLMSNIYRVYVNKPTIKVVGEEKARLVPVDIIAAYESILKEKEETISQLNNQITTLNGQISSLESQVSTLQGQLDQANAQISSLQDQVSSLQSEIDSLKSQLGTAQSMQYVMLIVGLIIGLVIGFIVAKKKK